VSAKRRDRGWRINWSPVVKFLRVTWNPSLSWLSSLIPPSIAVVTFIIAHGYKQNQPFDPTTAFFIFLIAIAALGFELCCLICTMGSYILDEIFVPPLDRAERLARKLPNLEEVVHSLVCTETQTRDARVDAVVAEMLQSDHGSSEALDRICTFAQLGMRLLLAFVFTDVSLECGSFISGHSGAGFSDLAYSFQSWWAFAEILDKSFYFNLVTIATVGFGDMGPKIFWARLVVDVEIMTSILFLTYGINILVSLVMDSTTSAWIGRKEVLTEFMHTAVNQRSRIA